MKLLLAPRAPQPPAPPQSVAQRDRLQAVLGARAPLHQLMPMLDQHPHIALGGTRQPDLWKIPPQQQIQQVLGVPPVVFLLACVHRPDLRWLAHHQLVPQLFQHLGKPARRTCRLDPHQRRLGQAFVETSGLVAFMVQPLLDHLARRRLHHRNLFKPRMQITPYNDHVRLLLR